MSIICVYYVIYERKLHVNNVSSLNALLCLPSQAAPNIEKTNEARREILKLKGSYARWS